MEIIKAHLTNDAFGFPRGRERRVEPSNLACLHITSNARTADYSDELAGAMAEREYANRPNSLGPSAHYYIARDGRILEAIDPIKYAAWSNGDMRSPDRDNKGIARALELATNGFNANEAWVLEIENLGHRPEDPVNSAQKQACAELIAREAKRTGIPINRNTVHAHADINSIDRAGCPAAPGNRENFMDDVISRARAILEPAEPIDTTPFTQADIDAAVAAAVTPLTTEITNLNTINDELNTRITRDVELFSTIATELRAIATRLNTY